MDQMAEMLRLDLIVKLLIASALGGAIGVERELSAKPAGFRTNLLICVGSALFTDISTNMSGIAQGMHMNGDPGRVAAQVVVGIGFIGAGTIMQGKGSVTGLTTAATMWVVSAIGMAVGASMFAEAFSTTLLVLIALFVLGKVEFFFVRRRAQLASVQISVLTRPAALRTNPTGNIEASSPSTAFTIPRGSPKLFTATAPMFACVQPAVQLPWAARVSVAAGSQLDISIALFNARFGNIESIVAAATSGSSSGGADSRERKTGSLVNCAIPSPVRKGK